MAKATSARRQPARTASPQELAAENRRAEEALAEELADDALRERAPSGFILEPKSKLALEAEAYQKNRNELVNAVTIIERSWAPATPVEIVAAFQALCEWISRIDEGLDGLRIGRVAELERRLAHLEERLNPDTDYNESAGDDETALDGLWLTSHNADGTRKGPEGGVDGEPVPDILHRRLLPQTWTQMSDCLVAVAYWVDHLMTSVIALEDAARSTPEPILRRDHFDARINELLQAVAR